MNWCVCSSTVSYNFQKREGIKGAIGTSSKLLVYMKNKSTLSGKNATKKKSSSIGVESNITSEELVTNTIAAM